MKHCTRLVWKAQIDETFFNPLNQRTQVYNRCWNMWVAMRCYLRRPLLLFHITIQSSWCAVYVWQTAVLTLHSQWRTVASFKEVLCWLSVSSGLNEDCCPAEMKYVFLRPTQASHHQHHNEGWRRPEQGSWPRLTFAKIVFYYYPILLLLFLKNIQTLNGKRAKGNKGQEISSESLLPQPTEQQACFPAHTLSHT